MDPLQPHQKLQEMINWSTIARCIQVVAESGVADLIDGRPRSAEELASGTGLDPDALNRMLRLLASYGIFRSEAEGYTHTPYSEPLRTDHPRSMRSFARMMNLPIMVNNFAHLGDVAKTGRPATDWAGLVEHFSTHPDESRIFNQAMVDKSAAMIPAVIGSYDLSQFAVVADIGGGHGHLLRAVLDSAPGVSGVLVDLPHVIADAEKMPCERITFQAADFFTDDLPEADAYMLMEVLHDWKDEEAVKILRSVRRAAKPTSKLLVVETLIPDTPEPHPAKVLDVIMLAVTGGRERPAPEYRSLLEKAGFRLERVIPTPSPHSIVEAVPS